VSPEFSEVLPNSQNPPSPNLAKLAPYMYFVESSFLENFLRTTKRYGVDHIMANHFAIPFIAELCAENGFARWQLHPNLTKERFLKYRKLVKEELGYLLGTYLCYNDLYFTSRYWNENRIAVQGKDCWWWVNYWPGAYTMKDIATPELARDVGKNFVERYGPLDNAYMDVHTLRGPYALDHEAGVEGAGNARVQVIANMDCIVESRKWFKTIASEGFYRWMYAGLVDMDYATIPVRHTKLSSSDLPILVDFDLLKIHPFAHGIMMSYGPQRFLMGHDDKITEMWQDSGKGEAPTGFYQYISASLAYGHMMITGYGYVPKLSRFIQLYCLMQGIQKEYLTDTVDCIEYHNGEKYLRSSQALMDGSYTQGRVCVRYKRGLRVQVNYNKEKNWIVDVNGTDDYELPPFGWVMDKPGEILAYSAMMGGKRVDYVSCPEYVYLNSGNTSAIVEGLEVAGAVWLKREGQELRMIPCGDLGPWEVFDPPDLPKQTMKYWDMRLQHIPDHRGCTKLVLNTRYLLNKKSDQVKVFGRDSDGNERQAKLEILDEDRLQIFPSGEIVDYILK